MRTLLIFFRIYEYDNKHIYRYLNIKIIYNKSPKNY